MRRSAGICAFPRKKLARIEVRDVRTPIWWGDIAFKMEGEKEVPILIRYGPPKKDAAGQILVGGSACGARAH